MSYCAYRETCNREIISQRKLREMTNVQLPMISLPPPPHPLLPHNLYCILDTISTHACTISKYEPPHEISNNVVCATSKASDQPAHMRSLIRAFASRFPILRVLSYLLNIIWNFSA